MSTTNPTRVLSEWDALQIKFGNYEAPPDEVTEVEASERAVDLVLEAAAEKERLEGRAEDDSEDELIRLREKRKNEILESKRNSIFGDLVHIGKAEFVSEVTETSKKSFSSSNEKEGCWVIVHLYSESVPSCIRINELFREIARKHPEVKFVKGIASDVLPNYPDNRLPTILCYKGGVCIHQIFDQTWATNLTLDKLLYTFTNTYKILSNKRSFKDPDNNNISEDDDSDYEQKDRTSDRGYSAIQLDRILNP